MAQARTLRKSKLNQLIDVTMLLFLHFCGLRVGEIASLRFDDVLGDKSNVLDKIMLDATALRTSVRSIFLLREMH